MVPRCTIPYLAGSICLLLLTASACSSRWTQSDSDFPSLSVSRRSGEKESGLTGFDPVVPGKTPSEVQLGSGPKVVEAETHETGNRRIAEVRPAQATGALQDVFFAFDSWALTEDGKRALARDAQWIKARPDVGVTIEGHCDERGSFEYNLILGENRAKAARNYLINLGVNPGQLAWISYGKELPFCRQHHEACYQQNRRGHLRLVPAQDMK